MSPSRINKFASVHSLLREFFPMGIDRALDKLASKRNKTGLDEIEEKEYNILCDIYDNTIRLSIKILEWTKIDKKNDSK